MGEKVDLTEERDWYFTWGYGQKHPNSYTVIKGNYGQAREEMVRRHGQSWAFQYSSAEAAGVKEWKLKEIQ